MNADNEAAETIALAFAEFAVEEAIGAAATIGVVIVGGVVTEGVTEGVADGIADGVGDEGTAKTGADRAHNKTQGATASAKTVVQEEAHFALYRVLESDVGLWCCAGRIGNVMQFLQQKRHQTTP